MANAQLKQYVQRLIAANLPRAPSRLPNLDIDALIVIATNQVQEVEDELWLLQTEPSFFLDQATLVEKNWYDTRPGMQGFDEATKYGNIALSVSYQRFAKTRVWRWLLEELHNVKSVQAKFSVEERTSWLLPPEYQLALSCLDTTVYGLLENGSRMDLREYVGIAPSFQKYWSFTQVPGNPKLYNAVMNQNVGVLFEKDRLMWYLYLVTLNPSEQADDDVPLILRHLDGHLDTCSRTEAGRINSVMYRFISELTVLHQINATLKPFEGFYPKMRRSFMELSDRSSWRFSSKSPNEPKLFSTPRRWAMAIQPLDKFRMPTGTRNEAWLLKASSVRMVLASLWRKLREDLTTIWRQAGHLEADIERYRAMLSQYETAEQLSRWAAEKERIVSTAKSKRWTDHETLVWEQPRDIEALQDKPTTEGFKTSIDQRDEPVQEEDPRTEASKDIKISSDQYSITHDQAAQRTREAKKPLEQQKPEAPSRYAVTKRSLNVIRLLFPSGRQDRGTVEWLEFVSLLHEMGFMEVRRSGSARTFKSDQGSITFHKPHPSTEMGPTILWRIGSRLSRRYGWNREMFGQIS